MFMSKYLLKLPSSFSKAILPLLKYLSFIRAIEFRMISKRLQTPEDLNILDVGCAEGVYSIEYARRGAFLTGFDVSREPISRANKLAKKLGLRSRVHFFVGDAMKLPMRNSVFDIVICNCVLEHISDDLGALGELNRVLKPDAYLLLTVDCKERTFASQLLHELPKFGKELLLKTDIAKSQSVGEGMRTYLANRYHIVHFYSLEQLSRKLRKVGFKIVQHKYYLTGLGARFFEFFHCFKFTATGGRRPDRLPYMLLSPFLYILVLVFDTRKDFDTKGYGLEVISECRKNTQEASLLTKI